MSEDHAHASGNKQYFVTWCLLLVMTAIALAGGYLLPHGTFKTLLLVGVTLAKILLIASIFMHLRFEKMNLVILTFSPIILVMIMYFFTHGEVGGSPTHLIITRPGYVIGDGSAAPAAPVSTGAPAHGEGH